MNNLNEFNVKEEFVGADFWNLESLMLRKWVMCE